MSAGQSKTATASDGRGSRPGPIDLYPSEAVQSATERMRMAPSWRSLVGAVAACANPTEVAYVLRAFRQRKGSRSELAAVDPLHRLALVWQDATDLAGVFGIADVSAPAVPSDAADRAGEMPQQSMAAPTAMLTEVNPFVDFVGFLRKSADEHDIMSAAASSAGFHFVPPVWTTAAVWESGKIESDLGEVLGYKPTDKLERNLAALDDALAARDSDALEWHRTKLRFA